MCFFLLGCFKLPIYSQESLLQFDKFSAINSTVGSVRDMVQDSNGFYWVASERGLFRFDGIQVTKINLAVENSLTKRGNNVYDICLDHTNQLIWAGTDIGLFSYSFHSDTVRYLDPQNFYLGIDLELQATHTVFADQKGEIWAEFGRYGFAQLSSQGVLLATYYLPLNEKDKSTGFDEKMANTILGISQDPTHESILWMNTRRGLLRFDKKTKLIERFIYYTENKSMMAVANSITCHHAHINGYVYLGTWNAGLLKFDPSNGNFTQFLQNGTHWKEKNGGSIHRVTAIAIDQSGNLWTQGSEGGSMFDVKKERFISVPSVEFRVNFQDREGNYWQYQPELRLLHHLKNQGLKFNYPPSFPYENLSEMPFDSQNHEIYCRGLSNDGAYWSWKLDKNEWQRYPLLDKENNKVKFSAYSQSKDGYFVGDGIANEIYFRPIGKNHFEKLPVTFPQNAGNLNMTCATNGDIFVTGHSGYLFWLRPPSSKQWKDKWQISTFSKNAYGGQMSDQFHCVSSPTFDTNGRLWLLTCNGFSIFSPIDSTFSHFYCDDRNVKHLKSYNHLLPYGQQMWVAGKGGFGWIEIDKPEVGLQKRYLSLGSYRQDNFSAAFLIKEKLWLCSSEGWMEFDTHKEVFRYFDFLYDKDLIPVSDHHLVSFEDSGVRLMDLNKLRIADEKPQPYISWVKVFEKPISLPGNPLSRKFLRLRPHENFFSIGFSALATYNTAGVRFVYQLEGLDPKWVFAEPGINAVSYTNVEGGDYTFKIRSTDSRGIGLNNIIQFKIRIGTIWYKTWWFRLTLVAVLCYVVYFFIKIRFRQQQILLENQRLQLEKELSLRNERDRIASEMHDDLGAGLSTIRFLSITAQQKEADPENAARISKIAANASQLMEKMSDIIWVMNSRNDSFENFVAYLRRYAADYLETHGLRFVMQTDGLLEDRKLTGEQRRSLLLAIKECLHNAVKHAEAKNVTITVIVSDKMEIIVQDDGKGLSENLIHGLYSAPNSLKGNGLKNISQRLSALGGKAIFENGKGTTVRLQFNFQS